MVRKAEQYSPEDSSREKKKSLKAFVDRVEPIRCFERELEGLKEDPEACSVLYYWGVGGIGKTHLMEHLLREADESSVLVDTMPAILGEDQIRVRYSLDLSTNEVEILYRLRTKLKEEYKKRLNGEFDFLLFDIAAAAYEEKSDEEHRIGDSKESRSSILDDLKNMGEVAGLSIPFYDVYEKARKGYSSAKNILGRFAEGRILDQYAEYIASVNAGSSEQVLKKLHKGFSYDLVRLVDTLRRKSPESLPVVIALDTLERLEYKTAENVNNLEYDDAWLFGRPDSYTGGLMESVPSVLWLLCGRDQIDGKKLPEECQVRIDTLGEADVKELLEVRNVSVSDEIAELICQVTEGVPVYVDICIDLCIERENAVARADFEGGITQIVNRYLQLMSDQDKLNLYLMSSLGQWTDEDFRRITDRLSDFRYLEISYNRLIRKSFILSYEGARRIFHNIVREAIYADRDYSDFSKKENLHAIVQYIQEQLEKNDIGSEKTVFYADRIVFLCQEIVSDKEDYEQIRGLVEKCCDLLDGIDVHKALEVRLAVYNGMERTGLDENESLQVKQDLGRALGDCGRYRDAFEIVNETYAESLRAKGEKHPDTLALRASLGNLYFDFGKYKEAADISKEVYEMRREVLGEENPDTLTALNDLAVAYTRLGMNDEATKLKQEVYEKRKRILPEDHPDLIESLNNIANAYSAAGEEQKALELHAEAYEKSKRIKGETNPDTLVLLGNLAINHFSLDHDQEAFDMCTEVVEKCRSVLGDDHPQTLMALDRLASVYMKRGDYDTARNLRHDVYEKLKTVLDEEHPETISTLKSLAYSYYYTGQYAEALQYYTDVYEIQKKVYGEDHPDTVLTLAMIGAVYRGLEQYEQSIPVFTKVYEQRCALFGKDHPVTIRTLDSIAEAYLKSGRYREAEEYYRQSYEQKLAFFDKDDSSIRQTQDRLIEAKIRILQEENRKTMPADVSVFGITAEQVMDFGLGFKNVTEASDFLAYMTERLERRIGVRIQAEASEEALEQLFAPEDEEQIRQWLETNVPDYAKIVEEEIEISVKTFALGAENFFKMKNKYV